MPRINELSPHVADLIAAGEVVERPGSVVKELVENSIDAGATALTVELKAGGMTYIRVTDNGCGMEPEDAARAFLRHATSKLKNERDLECIGTLGFRGEALAAISAVSRIDLMTRETGASEGVSVAINGGEIADISPAGCPEGTTIIVRDLFYNTPARLKFMKSDKAEGANVSQIMLRCALSHPEISIRYIKDGKEEFHTPGDGSVRSSVYLLLGRDFAQNLLEVDGGDEDVSVRGFISSPASGRGNRAYQFFFINGRYVRSKLLQSALEQAYKNAMFSGKFPACILYIQIKLGAVDVNVHPTKTEVKFLQDKKVFDGVYYAVLSALDKSQKMPELQITAKAEAEAKAEAGNEARDDAEPKEVTRNGNFQPGGKNAGSFGRSAGPAIDLGGRLGERVQDTLPHPEFQNTLLVNDPGSPNAQTTLPIYNGFHIQIESGKVFDADGQAENTHFGSANHRIAEENRDITKNSDKPHNNGYTAKNSEEPCDRADSAPEDCQVTWRIVGETMGTYIIVEQGVRLVIIDKHAAHERILFDKMKSESYDPMPQLLVAPFVAELGPEDTELLLENADFLREYGFELDRFGQGSVAMREVPGNIDSGDLDGLLSEICQKLRMGHRLDPTGVRDEVLHTVACKAAIKAGKMSNPAELVILVEKVLSGQVKYCPHGRPVSIEMTKSTLDKNFKRT